jgi:ElaB/YqjD/DUF883 family membrane-anchored ribosome-binding protein
MAQGQGEVEERSDRTADTSTAATAAAPTTDDIRSQIEQTRAEMGDTIDAIQTRLSPARAIADVKDSVTEATVGRLKRLADRTRASSRSALDTVRDNPLPFALLAAAAVGLIAGALNNGDWRRRPRAARALNDHDERNWRDRSNRVTPRRSIKRFLAAASAGAACWAIWRAQTAAPHLENTYPETPSAGEGSL